MNNTMSLTDREAAFIAFISTFMIFSFLSNACIVAVVVKIKTLRTVTNLFLTNLAVSDLILVSLILPLQVNNISHTDEYIECKLHGVCSMILYRVKKHKSPKDKSESVIELTGSTMKLIYIIESPVR